MKISNSLRHAGLKLLWAAVPVWDRGPSPLLFLPSNHLHIYNINILYTIMDKVCKKYKCICGKEFDTHGAYGAHVRFCEVQKQHKEDLKKIEETYEYVCGCGRRFKTESSLKSHARFCDKYVHKNNRYAYVDGVRT